MAVMSFAKLRAQCRAYMSYGYFDFLSNRISSRQSYQKHKLSDKLENFNPELSEIENMRANGFFRQYDCGNHRFVWLRR